MSSGKLFFSSSMRSRTRRATAMALASGRAKTARLPLGRPLTILVESRLRAASLTCPTCFEADLSAGTVAAENDVLEILRGRQPALRIRDRELRMRAGGDGLLSDVAGRHLHVLFAEGLDDVHGRHAHHGQLFRIEPEGAGL